ncbi:MAG: hypothetical protein PWQ55_143 [Chloroflexota bacterium]|nr:hypothetical protein [Chloroflexota bacterium]
MNYTFKIRERYARITIIHHRCADGTLWATAKRRVLVNHGQGWQPAGVFPPSYPRDLFGWSRPTARAMRADKCNLYVNRHGNVLGIRGGWVYALRAGQFEALFSINGDSVLHRSLAEDAEGSIYFGEYFMNREHIPVRIWRVSPQLDRWEVACELPGVRHVHGVYADPYAPGVLWAAVGDFKGECYLVRSDDGFHSMQLYGDGSQIWRAVNLFFTPDSVDWLTDSNLEQNHACRMQRDSGQLEIGQEIDCSAWYGCTTQEGLHVSFTTVEQGPGILSDHSSVLVSRDAFHWEKIAQFKKDFWRPVKVFKYGVISCPSGPSSLDDLYLSGEGLVGLDGCSLRVCISEATDHA